jgi:hypothetical protein
MFVKYVSCISSFYVFLGLIRENDHALEEFGHQEGCPVLLKAMQSNVEKLQIKSAFLLTYICHHHPAVKGNVNVSSNVLRFRARGSIVVEALCCKPEGHGFDSR